jgi:hypothetical protein
MRGVAVYVWRLNDADFAELDAESGTAGLLFTEEHELLFSHQQASRRSPR